MEIELDDLTLIKQEAETETNKVTGVRSVRNINTHEKRNIVEHKIPGMEGSIFQDLGREPVKISFEGIFQGENAKENLERIIAKFKLGTSVPFASDITDASDVTHVLIEELDIDDTGGVKNEYKYSIVLREYKIPAEEETPAPDQEEEANENVEDNIAAALCSINCITGKVLDSKGCPKKGVPVKIKWDKGEITLKTNEEGVYRQEELEPGKYTIIVDSEEYEGIQKEVVIKPGKEKAEVKEINPA